jgi:hypothetical protein
MKTAHLQLRAALTHGASSPPNSHYGRANVLDDQLLFS